MSALPVLSDNSISPQQIAIDLQRLVKGDVRFDAHHQLLYATDASLYQVKPIGVVLPASVEDVIAVLNYCAAHRIAVLPRGGGTSLAGQCTSHAVVVDMTHAMRRILSVDATNRLCHVEPGIGLDELNRQLLATQTGLLFAPDPATVAQASIGGCIGNNAAGARSIRYGRTSENVAGVDVALTSGHRLWLESGAGRANSAAANLAESVAKIVAKYASLIRERFPKTIRRNAGYGLDLVLKQMDAGITPPDLDLSGLICGSEGTLAAVLSAKLKLNPIPKFKGLAICSYATLEAALDAVNPILTTHPSALELLDDVVLEAAAGNNECRKYLRWLPPVDGQSPKAVLYIEYISAVSIEEVETGFAALRKTVGHAAVATFTDPGPMTDLWNLRKAGEPLLHGLPGHRKPHTFVEDNAVPVENLPEFVRGFKRIVASHGTSAAYYAHASVGVLHVRPLVDLHDPADRAIMQKIAVEIAELARQCGGVMSGEHGDGKVRGPLLETYFGSELMNAFGEIKNLFDPANILNPGDIVAPGPVASITEHFRIDADDQGQDLDKFQTYFEYEGGFREAVELCNGAGVCRKTAGGTMCPSYRVTLDERDATRGRANALRTALTGQASADHSPVWNDPGTVETLDLCLSCKACKSECPTNVDVAKLKAEYTAHRYAQSKPTLQAKVFGNVRTLNRLGAATPALANFFNRLWPMRKLIAAMTGLASQRSIPEFSRSLYRWFEKRKAITNATAPTVVLFGDCFVTFNESHIGVAAVQLLETLGYQVKIPRTGCCARALISTGLLPQAIETADQTLNQLKPFIEDANVKAILVAEPSCLSAFKDDWLSLKLTTPPKLRKQLAAKSFLVEEFVDCQWDSHPNRPNVKKGNGPVLLHGHCHQKALWGDATSANLIRRLVGDRLTVIPSGCCGMAGSFGYTAKHYDVSMKIGELSVFPPIRANEAAIILAPGTSCRHQIHDGTGRQALHPIELAAQLLCD